MSINTQIVEAAPLVTAFGSAIFTRFYAVGKNWQDYIIGLLGVLFCFFTGVFFSDSFSSTLSVHSVFDISLSKISVFIGAIYCASLFIGLFPIRENINLSSKFLFYIAGGLGIILSNNLPTFFVFWTFQRCLPMRSFLKEGTGGTYIIQHLLSYLCFIVLMFIAYQQGLLLTPMTEMPPSFFSWPVLILSFVIVYESHGIFPFHSWVHDVVGKLQWFEFSALFLSRAGVLLFVQLILPTLSNDPDLFKISLLGLSIFSSIYWSLRGLLEQNLTKTTTYFYIAQASLILTGLQADMTSAKGSYLHLMVISISGTALFSILNYIQTSFSFKRPSQFYGLAQYYPLMATLFCLFGFCLIGVPLGASFVVEDLVITGLLEQQPYLGLGHILATCLNGIVFFHAFIKIFLGPSPYQVPPKNRDLPLGRMVPYLFALIILILIGIMPYLFLEKITW